MVGEADPFVLLEATAWSVGDAGGLLGVPKEATENGSLDREMTRTSFLAPMGQLAAVYLCWVMDRISSEYSQPLPSKDG